MKNEIWREYANGNCILYTEEGELRDRITHSRAFRQHVRIREMARYYQSACHRRAYAWQYRVSADMLPQIQKTSGVSRIG